MRRVNVLFSMCGFACVAAKTRHVWFACVVQRLKWVGGSDTGFMQSCPELRLGESNDRTLDMARKLKRDEGSYAVCLCDTVVKVRRCTELALSPNGTTANACR